MSRQEYIERSKKTDLTTQEYMEIQTKRRQEQGQLTQKEYIEKQGKRRQEELLSAEQMDSAVAPANVVPVDFRPSGADDIRKAA